MGAIKEGWEEVKEATRQFSEEIQQIAEPKTIEQKQVEMEAEAKIDKKKTDTKIKNLTREKKLEAKLNKFYENQKVKDAKKAADDLEYLQKSKNKAGKAIGKASAITQVLIDAPKAAMGAFSALAPIPFIGPALGAAAAAAALLYSKEQITAIQKAQSGGIVQRAFGTPARGDFQPLLAEAGELVLPTGDVDLNRKASRLILEKLGETEDDFFRQREQVDVNIGIDDQASDLINAQTIERENLGIGVI